jgi:hypothetical protein
LAGSVKVLGGKVDSESIAPSEWVASLFKNMSRLNASTPRSTSGVRVTLDEDDVLEFARKGLRVVLVGARLGMDGCSDDGFDVVRSGTRAITR